MKRLLAKGSCGYLPTYIDTQTRKQVTNYKI